MTTDTDERGPYDRLYDAARARKSRPRLNTRIRNGVPIYSLSVGGLWSTSVDLAAAAAELIDRLDWTDAR